MKKIVIVLLCFALLVCSGCSFHADISTFDTEMVYTLDNGEKFSVSFLDESYKFKVAANREFYITKDDETITNIQFLDAQSNKEPIFTENIEEVFDEGSKDGHPYISYSLYDQGKLKYYYLWVVSETNCMLFETDISQEVLKDCFESITIIIQ